MSPVGASSPSRFIAAHSEARSSSGTPLRWTDTSYFPSMAASAADSISSSTSSGTGRPGPGARSRCSPPGSPGSPRTLRPGWAPRPPAGTIDLVDDDGAALLTRSVLDPPDERRAHPLPLALGIDEHLGPAQRGVVAIREVDDRVAEHAVAIHRQAHDVALTRVVVALLLGELLEGHAVRLDPRRHLDALADLPHLLHETVVGAVELDDVHA